ncbi:MAG: site-2 protease family protein [Hamadaea sp.]|uniref:site-2 protease family protein n=1 Tax=Hamadaea sp. TaxID=2024425 RepID=UPI001797FEA1|nr:site-2 protease family protein [Hamadaea sp.]NUT19847.1 site-2 protease family protein [Hamadaea sp.]
MTDAGEDYLDPLDDPLQRLAAEGGWNERARAIEAEVARDRRKALRRLPRPPRRRRAGISWLFLLLVALAGASGWAMWSGVVPSQAAVFVFILAGWLVSLCLHEYAHALVAHRGGDDTIAEKGYLRLNPLKYGHPLLTFVLPLFALLTGGLPLPGGAVLVESERLRSRHRDALVSMAGPAVNIVFAAVLLFVTAQFGPTGIYDLGEPHAAFWAGLTLLAYLQVASAALNLLPIPGLDGYGMIEHYLPERVQEIGRKIRPFGLVIVFLLLYLPWVRDSFGDLTFWITESSGTPVNGIYYGYQLFQFWRGWF